MKLKAILALSVLLWGCSKKPATQTDDSNVSKSPGVAQQKSTAVVALPFQLTFVEDHEAKDKEQIKNRETVLLAAKNYDSLDQIAHEYRESMARYPNGLWKLNFFMWGLNWTTTILKRCGKIV